MNLIKGNILDQKGFICHQVNCQRVAGAGLAKQISDKFTGWREHFINTPPVLGDVGEFVASPNQTILNLYGQNFYGRGQVFTNYVALEMCFKKVAAIVAKYNADACCDYEQFDVFIPYGIGCGLAGGDWKIVRKIIEKELPAANIAKFRK